MLAVLAQLDLDDALLGMDGMRNNGYVGEVIQVLESSITDTSSSS